MIKYVHSPEGSAMSLLEWPRLADYVMLNVNRLYPHLLLSVVRTGHAFQGNGWKESSKNSFLCLLNMSCVTCMNSSEPPRYPKRWGAIAVPISQLRKLRHKEDKSPAWGHTVAKWRIWDVNLDIWFQNLFLCSPCLGRWKGRRRYCALKQKVNVLGVY